MGVGGIQQHRRLPTCFFAVNGCTLHGTCAGCECTGEVIPLSSEEQNTKRVLFLCNRCKSFTSLLPRTFGPPEGVAQLVRRAADVCGPLKPGELNSWLNSEP
mmetsp:Transcript_12043/g.27819  ORF Transcript_12043/g.27819 Transcript_12043/m.27819 type:complete len:102 (+) Transcript_12043:310-615(+)